MDAGGQCTEITLLAETPARRRLAGAVGFFYSV
jgi:hypothetical protein